jgi:hypothetical protein
MTKLGTAPTGAKAIPLEGDKRAHAGEDRREPVCH